MENSAKLAECYYPNAVVQEIFVKVHQQYFTECPTREEILPDAPASVVLMLTLLPVSVIPALVYIVIRKSSVIDWETQTHTIAHYFMYYIRNDPKYAL